ncbi:hypothetical protein J6590_072714 [Homalodisca vitripennis]|nr:hypothetical protein J6590_072714 [Homalodisca vitripennis]
MTGSMTERLRPPPSSHCTYQTNNERVLVCSLCSISFTSSQDLRNHQNEQHPDNPYAKTKPPNENQISSKRRCIEAGTTYYSPTLPGPYTTHRDSSLSTTSQEPSTLESTNDPLA